MGHHKTEHDPSHFHGAQTTCTVSIQRGSVKTILYRLHQIDTHTHAGDTIFGDSYCPALSNSKCSDITVCRIGGDHALAKPHEGLPTFSAYGVFIHDVRTLTLRRNPCRLMRIRQ